MKLHFMSECLAYRNMLLWEMDEKLNWENSSGCLVTMDIAREKINLFDNEMRCEGKSSCLKLIEIFVSHNFCYSTEKKSLVAVLQIFLVRESHLRWWWCRCCCSSNCDAIWCRRCFCCCCRNWMNVITTITNFAIQWNIFASCRSTWHNKFFTKLGSICCKQYFDVCVVGCFSHENRGKIFFIC